MKLIFDLKATGHHREYLEHLLMFLRQTNQGSHFHFLINERLSDFVNDFPEVTFQTVILEEVTDKVAFGYLITALATGRYSSVVLMELDMYQRILIKEGKKIDVPLCGILFGPPLRVSESKGLYRRLFTSIKRLRKKFQLRLLLQRTPRLNNIFLLNDARQASLLSKQTGRRFHELPDPVVGQEVERIPLEEQAVKKLLIIGTIDYRKNVLTVMRSLPYLREFGLLELQIIGKGEDVYYEKLIKQETELLGSSDWLSVYRENTFITTENFEKFVVESDVLLVTYLDFYASSGILNHAILHSKPVVVPEYGLLGEQVRIMEVGEICDPYDPQSIANALILVLKQPVTKDWSAYLESHSPGNFAKTLLNFPSYD
jgi:glycosyltransferase involved in cell wall biosynthesis